MDRLDLASEASIRPVMTHLHQPHLSAPVSFGRRLVPPLTAAENVAAAIADIETQRAAARSRMEAHLVAHWDDQLAKLATSIREGGRLVARRRLGVIGDRALVGLGGIALGWKIGFR